MAKKCTQYLQSFHSIKMIFRLRTLDYVGYAGSQKSISFPHLECDLYGNLEKFGARL